MDSELSIRLCTKQRTALIIKTLNYYLADEQKVKALCFCTDKEHAKFAAESLSLSGLKVDYLVSGDSEQAKDKRKEVVNKLRRGEINYLCVADIFNEGVDIPEVDTVLFLRPTESLTIFLQQLGRGLRLCPEKEVLTYLILLRTLIRSLILKVDLELYLKRAMAESI
ncbi:helicase-related protein [Treponema sp.]|uniref:helicase-related protein n=1 Tax=Treponema sp. TaxID=166 RepID=UPI0039A3661A